MRVEIKNDNVHTMTLFSDDALQFENLAACGIHRDASLRILQSACSDCESLYNILKSIDCNNKGHDANELIDGNTKVDAKADKKVYAKVDAKVDANADKPCGKQHFRDLPTPDWASPLTKIAYYSVCMTLR